MAAGGGWCGAKSARSGGAFEPAGGRGPSAVSGPASSTWVMWEARAADGRTDELLAWVLQQTSEPGQVYASEDRVVAIYPANLSETSAARAGPPSELLARPAYQWEFERIR